jgi:hypothetical protein
VNCTEAQALLAAYHELKNDEKLTTELDVHLEHCASCRQVLARNSLIGDKLRSMSAVEPPPEMHEKLMHTLAIEHLRFLHRSAARTPSVPEFLKPYLQEQTQQTETRDLLTAFSTAETGPLPLIRLQRQRRSHMSPFAVVGLAAMFLMVLMMGGLTSLLLLAHGKLESTSYISHSLDQPSNVAEAKYTTNTPYQHVISAIADRSYIYYTAYSDAANHPWMLEQLDRTTHVSTPLLPTTSENPLVVLGSSNGWLVWLQLDVLKASKNKFVARSFTRTWSLHYLSLTSPQTPGVQPSDPMTLFSGLFDESVAPNWASTPVQGMWFIQDALLVAMIDKSGNSHLVLFELGTGSNLSPVEIATASPGHAFTSPTATSDGTSIYWSEEWRSDDSSLHSNIWAQQVLDNIRPAHGAWIDHTTTVKYLFRSDGMSFQPQVADDSLFLLSTADSANSTQATVTTTLTPAPTVSVDTTPPISRVDPSIYGVSPDDSIQGTVLMLPIHGDLTTTLATQMNKAGRASSLQVGADFAVWQSDKGYEMYDVRTGYVTIGEDVLNGARFLAVNGNTATWVAGADNGTNSTTPSSVTLIAFNWPEA